jgi:hypothetical protein
VWHWGDGVSGTNYTVQQVSGPTNVLAIATGGSHGLALKSDGTVTGWGSNSYSQTSGGSGLTTVVAIAAGPNHSLALKSDGTVWGWGYNSTNELGDGTTTNRATPVQASSLTGVTSLGAGHWNGYVGKSDGTVRAWGRGTSGELGNGTTGIASTSVQILTDETPPSAPTNLQISNLAANSLTLTWGPATDGVGVTGYEVFRAGVSLGTTSGLSMDVTGLSSPSTWGLGFAVRARDAAGNWSVPVGVFLVFADTHAPTAPTALNWLEKTATTVTLLWSPSSDVSGVAGYYVYRGATQLGPTSELVYTDSGLTASTAYSYTVKAFNYNATLSAASPTLNVTTTADFSADGDGDGIPDAVETALGTNGSGAANPDTTNPTQQNIHRPAK